MGLKQVLQVTTAIGVASEIIYFIWRKRLISKLCTLVGNFFIKEYTEPYFYQVLMFPDKIRPCKPHFWGNGCHFHTCFYSHEENSLSRFVTHMLMARRTLDVCVYTMSDRDLADFVIGIHRRGIFVRIITHDESANFTGTQIGKFRGSGIPVRKSTSGYLMHHKFVIIDGEKVITGSFNWTSHAATANNENVIVTNKPQIVQPYLEEFNKLWKQFNPAVTKSFQNVQGE